MATRALLEGKIKLVAREPHQGLMGRSERIVPNAN
jgi:hypothetical protein